MSAERPGVMRGGTDERNIFQEARDRFLETLSNEEKAALTQVNSPAQLLDDLTRLRQSKDGSQWMKIASAVQTCNDRLQPYFDIVTAICQSTTWASVGWGAFRLVLKVCYAL